MHCYLMDTLVSTLPPAYTNDGEVAELRELMAKYGLYAEIRAVGAEYQVALPAQKITLNEVDMNTLFFDVLFHIPHRMEYAPIGGEGCDFYIKLYAQS